MYRKPESKLPGPISRGPDFSTVVMATWRAYLPARFLRSSRSSASIKGILSCRGRPGAPEEPDRAANDVGGVNRAKLVPCLLDGKARYLPSQVPCFLPRTDWNGLSA